MMNALYSPKLQQAVDTLLTAPAVTASTLRQAATNYAAILSGVKPEPAEIPEDLESYLKKVALYAYKTMDADTQRLIEAGYNEDAIFELTLCTALGAGLVRLESGLNALKGKE